MASRGVAPMPRGKPSGLPFHAKFVNVAKTAGLTAPVIYGDEGRADYILDSYRSLFLQYRDAYGLESSDMVFDTEVALLRAAASD